jgi:hypothetical protein
MGREQLMISGQMQVLKYGDGKFVGGLRITHP